MRQMWPATRPPTALRGRRGLTGLETAIILIAFVIVAAAFSFAVLNVGFQTTQRSQEVIQGGLREAASAIELDGAVIAAGNTSEGKVLNINFTIKMSTGRQPIDLSTGKLSIAYTSKNKFIENVYTNSTAGARIKGILSDGDNLIEFGEKFLVTIYITGPTINDTIGANDEVKIELKPTAGAVLTILRTMPASIDKVMFLG